MPDDSVNGADAPGCGRQIVITFHPDGTPAVQVSGGVSPTNLAAAAFWLGRLAGLQVDHELTQALRTQAPRVVVPR